MSLYNDYGLKERNGNSMMNKKRRFVDDGWAVWVAGDDTSTVYIKTIQFVYLRKWLYEINRSNLNK